MAFPVESFNNTLEETLKEVVFSSSNINISWSSRNLTEIKVYLAELVLNQSLTTVDVCVCLIKWVHENKLVWTSDASNKLYKFYGEFVLLVAILCEYEHPVELVMGGSKGLGLLERMISHGFEDTEPHLREWLSTLLP